MNIKFPSDIKFDEYISEQKNWQSLCTTKCSCGHQFEMQISRVSVTIGIYRIDIQECPIMVCENCKKEKLCPDTIMDAFIILNEMRRMGIVSCRFTMKKDERFKYAEEVGYKYDSRDIHIPGLNIDLEDQTPRGFSCPVYFDKKVLNSFFADDNYELDIFSESYGSIAKKGEGKWPYEWDVLFGINKNDKVVIFLGDLDQIPIDDRAVYWLKSYNIPSDHSLVSTEFYKAQVEGRFSDPIREQQIISLRNNFFTDVQKNYGINLFHLENEIENKKADIKKPINYSEREIKENIILLDGILNEGIDCGELRKLYIQLGGVDDEKIKTKTRKLLESIIALSEGKKKAHEIISPLYELNDLRVCFAHLLPESEIQKIQDKIVREYNLLSFNEYKKMYTTLLNKLYNLYRYLSMWAIRNDGCEKQK